VEKVDYATFRKASELRTAQYVRGETNPKSFEDIFGNLSNLYFSGDLDLSSLNLNSLKGCPAEIRRGHFTLYGNPNLKSLDYFPARLALDKQLVLQAENISSMKSVDINSYKFVDRILIYLYYADTDFRSLEIDIAIGFSLFRQQRGLFNEIQLGGSLFDPTAAEKDLNKELDYDRVEYFHNLYKRVDFNEDKFRRTLELI